MFNAWHQVVEVVASIDVSTAGIGAPVGGPAWFAHQPPDQLGADLLALTDELDVHATVSVGLIGMLENFRLHFSSRFSFSSSHNSLVQAAKARACGYRNKNKIVTIIYLTAAKLPYPPSLTPPGT